MQVGEVRIINDRLSYITSGDSYPVNFWTWRTIRKNGTLGKEYRGYGTLTLRMSKPIPHEVIVKVNSFDLLKVKE